MVVAGALDGDDEVSEAMVGQTATDPGDESVEPGSGVVDDGGLNEDIPVGVDEHPFGAGLGAVDDDAEVCGAGLLDPGVDGPRAPGDGVGAARSARSATRRGGHGDTSGSGRRDIPKPT